MKSVEERMNAALGADSEELWSILKDPHPEVISNAVLNRNFTEDMALFIAKKRTMTAEVLGFLASDVRFRESDKLRLALCRNPNTPQRIVFSLLKFIRIFDLSDIARDQNINVNVRRKIEYLIAERIPSMPLGVRTALARRTSTNILLSLMESGDERVISVCLDSPLLTEGHLFRLINRPATKQEIIKIIAKHAKWSLRYYIKFALLRNFHTPTEYAVQFITGIKTGDLKELYSDPKLPSSTKPFIFRELSDRGETVEIGEEEVHNLSGDEDDSLRDTPDE